MSVCTAQFAVCLPGAAVSERNADSSLHHETQEVTDGLFHCWYTLTNFENNKAVAPVDFEFFLHGMLVLYMYYTLLYIDFISLPSDSVLVFILVDYYLKEANDSYYK